MFIFWLSLFLGISSWAQDPVDTVHLERAEAILEVADTVSQSFEYRLLLEKIAELENKVESLENPKDPKKNVMKMIGYTSSTVGLITSVWGIYEKSLSLRNSQTELVIRLNTHKVLTSELQVLKSMEPTASVTEAIVKKNQLIAEVNEKLANIKLRIKISRLGLTRGIFKGVAAVGVFALTLFIDEVMDWFYKALPPKAVALSFLSDWDVQVFEAGLYHAKYMTPQERSLFYFADSDALGIPEEEFLKALAIYKRRNPEKYQKLVQTAIKELTLRLRDQIMREISFVDLKINSLKPFEIKMPEMPRDGTYVKPAIPVLR